MTARRTLSLGPVSVSLAGLAAGALGFAPRRGRAAPRDPLDRGPRTRRDRAGRALARAPCLRRRLPPCRRPGHRIDRGVVAPAAQRRPERSHPRRVLRRRCGPDDRARARSIPGPRPGVRSRTAGAVLLVAVVVFAAYVGAETPSVHWFGGGITHGPSRGRDVALTFDDGPNLTATLPIMRILDAAGVKGTFFEVGHGDRRGALDHRASCTAHGQLPRQPFVPPRPVALARSALSRARADPSGVPEARSECARRSTGRRTAIARRSSRTS